MAQSNASSFKDPHHKGHADADGKELKGDALIEAQRQAYHEWVQRKSEFEKTHPSEEERQKFYEDNPEFADAHDCEACGGTGIVGGPPPKPMLKPGKEPFVERAARSHSDIEVPPAEKHHKAKDTEDKK